jgi:hypothetical protein
VLLLGKVSFMQDQARPARHHSFIKALSASRAEEFMLDMLVCFLRFMRRGRDRFSAPPERRDLRAVAKVAWRAPSMLHGTQGRVLELPSWKGYDG